MLCDEQSEPGGSLLEEHAAVIDGQSARQWLADTLTVLAGRPHVTLLTRTTAFGYFPHNLIGLCERITDHLAAPAAALPRERLWQVRAREVVLATGAIERPLVFPGNDRPGVMLASAAATYLASLRSQCRLAHRRRDRLRCGLCDCAEPAGGRLDDRIDRRRARLRAGPRTSRRTSGRSRGRRAGQPF
jgi:hypothetical protein